jgi:hypothetical protein
VQYYACGMNSSLRTPSSWNLSQVLIFEGITQTAYEIYTISSHNNGLKYADNELGVRRANRMQSCFWDNRCSYRLLLEFSVA